MVTLSISAATTGRTLNFGRNDCMSHIHLYMNNPTAGAVDGTEISSGDETLPLAVDLDASTSDSQIVKCAVRCDENFSLKGGATIYFEGTSADLWKVASDDGYDSDTVQILGDWQDAILVEDVADTNRIFWVRADSTADEEPANDSSVDMKAAGIAVQKGAN